MNDQKMLSIAISITAHAFREKYDKGGNPYILHCLNVMYNVGEDPLTQMAAVMHDLIEDTEWTYADLISLGFSVDCLSVLDNVTHRDGEDYDDYIRRVATDPRSVKIKRADLEHNSLITRMKGLRAKDFKRLEKYHKAYTYLSE